MDINHGCLQARVTKQLLDDADVVVCLQKVGGEGVAESVGGDALGNPCPAHGRIECPLQVGLVEMRASPLSGFRRNSQIPHGKEPLMNKLLWRLWILLLNRVIEKDTVIPVGQIPFM